MGTTSNAIVEGAAARAVANKKRISVAERFEGKVLNGKYRLDKFVGKGGMGAVFKGFHLELRRDVAIKILWKSNEDDSDRMDSAISRFKRESAAAAMVKNDHVVSVSDCGYDPELDAHFMIMEYVRGQSLMSLLKERGRLTLAITVDILRQALDGTEAIHGAGIIHRDLKPSNILLTKVGERYLVKLCDFGISKVTSTDATQTAAGVMVGTLLYMSPETFRGKEVDARADLFAIGIIAYEMLTGEQPFHTPEQTLKKVAQPLHQVVRGKGGQQSYPASIEAFVAKSMAKDRSKRHQTASAMLGALNACQLTTGSKVVVTATVLLLSLGFAGIAMHESGTFKSIVDSMPAVSMPTMPEMPALFTNDEAAPAPIPTAAPAATVEPLAPPPVLEQAPTIASARAHLNAKEYEKAASDLEYLRKQNPRDPSLLFQLGQAYGASSETAHQATEAFKTYLQASGKKDPRKVQIAKGWIGMHR